jgi:hypothetical protein
MMLRMLHGMMLRMLHGMMLRMLHGLLLGMLHVTGLLRVTRMLMSSVHRRRVARRGSGPVLHVGVHVGIAVCRIASSRGLRLVERSKCGVQVEHISSAYA